MNIFDIIADILFLKKRKTIANIDNETSFSPFMLNRWISMYSNALALKCNLLNKYIAFNKHTSYSLFYSIFDKVPTKKITYFKKKKEEANENDTVPLFSKALEISQREVKLYSELLTSIKL